MKLLIHGRSRRTRFPFVSIVKRIESPDEEARENAITLLNVLLLQAPTRKKKAQLVSQFENVGIYDALARQLDADYDKVMISDNKSEDEESPAPSTSYIFSRRLQSMLFMVQHTKWKSTRKDSQRSVLVFDLLPLCIHLDSYCIARRYAHVISTSFSISKFS